MKQIGSSRQNSSSVKIKNQRGVIVEEIKEVTEPQAENFANDTFFLHLDKSSCQSASLSSSSNFLDEDHDIKLKK